MFSVESGRGPANGASEYCHLPASVYAWPFHVDHIVARQHGGSAVLENLAFSCLHCNRHKGPNLAGTDPKTGELTRLFHPRTDEWNVHFEWAGAALAGKTAIGRTTIHVLGINNPDFVGVREQLMREQAFPFE